MKNGDSNKRKKGRWEVAVFVIWGQATGTHR